MHCHANRLLSLYKIRGIFSIHEFDRTDDGIFCHIGNRLVGVECRMRADNHIGIGTKDRQTWIVKRLAHTVKVVQTALMLHHIQSCKTDFAALDTIDQRIRVDQGAPAQLIIITSCFIFAMASVPII